MRVFLLVVMIVLLPLRGWAGQVMAVDMAQQQVAGAQVAAVAAIGDLAKLASTELAAMPDECPLHAGGNSAGSEFNTPAGQITHCSACDTCELCLALASVTATQFSGLPFVPSTARITAQAGHVSADLVNLLKPPIF